MKIDYAFYLSYANLRRRKLRSFLTIGGMAIGVSLITFLTSLGFGLQRLIQNQITNAEQLTVLNVTTGDSSLLQLNSNAVSEFQNYDNVKAVSPSISLSGQATRADQVTDVAVYGVDPAHADIEGIQVEFGTPFTASDAKEIIITSTALNLIGLEDSTSALGQEVTLKLMVPKQISETSTDTTLVPTDLPVKVVGTIKDDQLTVIYVPLKVLQDLGFPTSYSEAKVKVGAKDEQYSVAKVKVTDQAKLPEVRSKIEELGYQVSSVADTVGQVDKIFLIFQLIVAGFGMIAMFVAALGALNTLTVSLLERTREIGLMKAYGATSADIYRLFLVEAISMGMVGGMLGIGLGIVSGMILDRVLVYMAQKYGGQAVSIFYTPWQFILIMLAVVSMISLFTGLYPSRRAATIKVLEAMSDK